jgi:Ca2+-binding RTX toxin-like protein
VSGTIADMETVAGTTASEVITGAGGTGDTLVGGDGDDIYLVTGVTARVVEAANEGIDTLKVYSDWGRLDDNIENLELIGSTHSNGYGNNLDNTLIGNAGRNRLDGGAGDDIIDGGAGNDTLVGGEGQDRFLFTGPNPGADWIIKFDLAQDIVQVDQSLIGSATVADLLSAATADDYGTRIDVGDFRLTLGKIDPSELNAANFELI